MDFASPQPVIDALAARAAHGIYGYTLVPDTLVAAIIEYLDRRYGWRIEPEWLVWLPSLVTGITLGCAAAGERGDEVLTVTPAYPPFLRVPGAVERRLITVPALHDGHRWQLPLAAMEAAVTPATRVLLLCHPHNPLGRRWDRGDLEAIAAFCRRHNLVLVSDEIHCDLLLDPAQHVPAALVTDPVQPLITLMSPSKTFNLPGLGFAYAVIPDPDLRRRFERTGKGITPAEPHCFAVVAAEAAYRHGDEWREGLLNCLRGNRDLIEQFIAQSLPRVGITHIEATYLAWLDVRQCGRDNPMQACLDAGLALSTGSAFGDPGYLRLNFGCPRSTLQEGLRRLQVALG
jgi:cystathionine beta-lyase